MTRFVIAFLLSLLAMPAYAQQGVAVGPIPPCAAFGTTSGTCLQGAGALGSPSSIGTLPAFTQGGTISGGGNQLNNIIIGTTTPLAGSFTTLSASSSVTASAANGFFLGANLLAAQSGVNTTFSDSSGNIGLYLGNVSGPANYYDNTTHNFRARAGASTFASMSSTGLTLTVLSSDTATADATVCARSSDNLVLKGTGALGICLGTSGAQFKTAFAPMAAGINELMQIDMQNYRYREGHGDSGARLQYGPTADDVGKVLPDLANYDHDGKAINYDSGALLFIGLRSIQQMKADYDNLRAFIVIIAVFALGILAWDRILAVRRKLSRNRKEPSSETL